MQGSSTDSIIMIIFGNIVPCHTCSFIINIVYNVDIRQYQPIQRKLYKSVVLHPHHGANMSGRDMRNFVTSHRHGETGTDQPSHIVVYMKQGVVKHVHVYVNLEMELH